MSTGVELISDERERQLREEGYAHEHDDIHDGGELAAAACCYAAPERIYKLYKYDSNDPRFAFVDPWPWDVDNDKRVPAHHLSDARRDPKDMSTEWRIDLLVKAGALLAAEIDRLQRKGTEDADDDPAVLGGIGAPEGGV